MYERITSKTQPSPTGTTLLCTRSFSRGVSRALSMGFYSTLQSTNAGGLKVLLLLDFHKRHMSGDSELRFFSPCECGSIIDITGKGEPIHFAWVCIFWVTISQVCFHVVAPDSRSGVSLFARMVAQRANDRDIAARAVVRPFVGTSILEWFHMGALSRPLDTA